jgi:hypothetical protein
MYSRKDTLKDHIRGKHGVCLPGELNRLVHVFLPENEGPGGGRRNRNAAQKNILVDAQTMSGR